MLQGVLIIVIISFISSMEYVLIEDSSDWCYEEILQDESWFSLRNLVCPLGRYK